MATSKSRGTGNNNSKAATKNSAPARKDSASAASSSRGDSAAASKKSAAPKKAAAPTKSATGGRTSASPAGKSASSSRNGSASASATGRGTAASRGAAATRGAASKAKGGRGDGSAKNDLEKILQDMMKDIYYAEKKLSKALGKMAKNATDPKLKDAFTTHQGQTGEQITKLEQAFGVLGLAPKAKKCAAMDGLLEEADEHIKEYERGAGLDAAMIAGAQKVEHYEISAYGSMRSFATTLGYKEAARIFEEIREQESDTDELLTTIAEGVINPKAEQETQDIDDNEKNESGDKNGDNASSGRGSRGGDSGSSDDDNDGGGRGISGSTDGADRGGQSNTGEAMGY